MMLIAHLNIKGKRHEALTVPEVLAGAVIVSLAILPVLTLLSEGRQQAIITASELVAVNFASSVMSYLESLPFDEIDEQLFERHREELSRMLQELPLSLSFDIRVKPYEFYKEVTLRVDWQEKERPDSVRKRSLEINSLFARENLQQVF